VDDYDTVELLRDAMTELATRLELAGAGASARDMRAAFDVLAARQSGWPKTCSHLLRETVRETLDALAPPSLVPTDLNGFVTKRAQIAWIVGSDRTLGVWAEAVVTSTGKLHSLLSAEAKNDGDPRVGWQGLIGLLETVMGLVRTLLDQASRSVGRSARQ
jgi:hypothetical protein